MWTFGTRQSLLSEMRLLLREQNSLLRELIAVQTGTPAQTPRTPASGQDPAKRKPLTDKDVVRVTREDLLEAQRKAEEADKAPWRTPPPTDAASK